MGYTRQEYWSGLPCPPSGDLPDPGIKLGLMSPELAGGLFNSSTTWQALSIRSQHLNIMLAYYLLFEGGTWKYSFLQNIEKLFWQIRENGLENEIYYLVNYLNSVSI